MSEKNITPIDFVKQVFVSHLEDKNITESYKSFTDDADIFGLLPSGSIHGIVAIKTALKTFLTFTNVDCDVKFSDEVEKSVAEDVFSISFVMNVKNLETQQVMVTRISGVVLKKDDVLKISSLDISVVDRNSMPTSYFVDEIELGYENEFYRDILSDVVSAGILGCYIEPEFPIYIVDEKFVKLLGYTNKKELLMEIENNASNMIYHEDLPFLVEKFKDKTNIGEEFEVTFRVRKKSGRFIWIKITGKIVKMQERLALAGVCRDITETVEVKQKLQESEKRLRLAIGGAQMLVWEYDVVNKTARYPQGTEIGEVGREIILSDYPERIFNNNIIVEEQREELREFYKRIEFGDETSIKGEFWMLDAASNIRKCHEYSYSIVRNPDGKGIMAYGLARDVTESKFTEKRFREELSFRNKSVDNIFSTACINLTLGIVENLRHGDTYVKDEKILTTVDYRERSMNYLDECEMTDEQNKNVSMKNLLKLFEKGVTEVREVYRAKLKGGNRVWVQLDINILKSPKTGNILAFLYNRDITEEKVKSLISQNILSQNYLEVGVIDVLNDSYTRYHALGYDVSKYNNTFPYTSGMDVFCEKRVAEKDKKRVRRGVSIEYIKEQIEKHGVCEFQFLATDHNGVQQYNMMVVKPLYEGATDMLLSTRSNVDAIVREELKKQKKLKKSAQDAKKANSARNDFFAGISHDMRTPMNAIIGMSALGIEETSDKTIQKYFKDIDASAHFLLGLINDALDSSQIEKNVLKLKYEPYALEEFFHYVNTMVRSLCEAKNIEFTITEPKDYAKYISTDKLRFNQIFFNLLSNAVKFTPENGRIDFILEFVSRANGVVVMKFIVKDTGIGMSKEFQKKMFKQYVRESAPDNMNQTGTGLGLFITKYVVELMGGTISVESEVGKGSEFTVELALQELEIDESKLTDGNVPLIDTTEILEGKRILLCEDNLMNSQIAVRLLEKVGLTVDCAENGEIGLDKFNNSEEGYYDAILMDIRMPVMDGLNATKFIRSLERMDSKTIPIIAMSANTSKADVGTAIKAGMNAHIPKPFDKKELYNTISVALLNKNNK